MRNKNVALLIFHPSEKLSQHHGGIRRPIAIVSAVQSPDSTKDCNLQMRVSPCAENNGLLSTLINRSVTHQPHVAVNQIAVSIEDRFQVRRSCLFLALPDETDIGPKWDLGGTQGV